MDESAQKSLASCLKVLVKKNTNKLSRINWIKQKKCFYFDWLIADHQ